MRRELFIFCVLILSYVFLPGEDDQDIPSPESPSTATAPKKKAGIIGKVEGVVFQAVRTESASLQVAASSEAKMNFSDEESEELKGLPRGYHFLPNVRAIKESDYKPALGKEMLRKNHLVFFRSTQAANMRVVYDLRRDSLQPLAPTLKLRNVSEEEREKNIREGRNEYSYHADLKLQFIQSSHENLMDDYQEYTSSGITPELEVISAVHTIK